MDSNANLYLTADIKISDVVFDNPPVLLMLEHFNINVPLQEKTIKEICLEINLNPEVFLSFANLYCGVCDVSLVHFSYNEIQSVIDFLKNGHNYFLHEKYPEIRQNLLLLFEVNNQNEIALVEDFFNEYFKEVTEHLKYEDEVVFPYITNLHRHILQRSPVKDQIAYSVHEYKEHHDDIEEKLNDLKNLLVKYLPGNNDQKIRRKLFLSLSALEQDLNIHAKIEDMILIPLVEKMEFDLKALK